jgi:putative tricarboxylic transport membrane protein
MVSKGSFLPIFQRPVAFLLFLIIVYTILSQIPAFKRFRQRLMGKIFRSPSP